MPPVIWHAILRFAIRHLPSAICDLVIWEQDIVRYTRHKTGRVFNHPIYPWLRPLLERLLAENKAAKGRIFKMKDVRHSLTAATCRLRLPRFTQRSLRAFLIRRLWASGVNVKLIAKWQGHCDGGVLIMKVYTEVFGSNDKAYGQAELAKVTWSNVLPIAADAHPSSP